MGENGKKYIEKTKVMVYNGNASERCIHMNRKVYNAVMSSKSDNNIRFADLQNLIIDLGFQYIRQNGSHRQYYHNGINAFMNIQKDGSKAKGYEVRQLRKIITKYDL